MTTAPRIQVSIHTVRAALKEWHEQHSGRAEPQRAQAQVQVERLTSEEYADAHAQFFFELLQGQLLKETT